MVEQKSSHVPQHKRTMSTLKWPIIGASVVVLAALVTVIILRAQPLQKIETTQYQAVYLINGQMYFGKLQNTEGTYLYMRSPYMPQSTTSSEGQTTDANTSTLVRVKDQLWGPEDSIAIRSDQVAFWQNLRDDSKVSQAIKVKE